MTGIPANLAVFWELSKIDLRLKGRITAATAETSHVREKRKVPLSWVLMKDVKKTRYIGMMASAEVRIIAVVGVWNLSLT
jgi:hypothetical protein